MMQIEGHTFDDSRLNADSLIIDIGGNQGNFSRAMVKQFDCKVMCFEPDIDAFCHLLGTIDSAKFQAYHMAVAGNSGKKLFRRAGPCSGGNSILEGHLEFEQSPDTREVYPVFGIALEAILLALPKVDLVKMDCEGAELEIITQTSLECLRKVQQMTVEFHHFCFDRITQRDNERAIRKLAQAGFVGPQPGAGLGNKSDFFFYRE